MHDHVLDSLGRLVLSPQKVGNWLSVPQRKLDLSPQFFMFLIAFWGDWFSVPRRLGSGSQSLEGLDLVLSPIPQRKLDISPQPMINNPLTISGC